MAHCTAAGDRRRDRSGRTSLWRGRRRRCHVCRAFVLHCRTHRSHLTGASVRRTAQMTRLAPLCRITLGGRAAWACSSHRACFGSPARVRVRHCHWRQLRWPPALALNDFSFRNFGLLFICRPQASWAEGTRPKDRRFINMQTRGSGTRDLLEASKPLSRLAAVDLCEVLNKDRCLSLRIVLPQLGN